MLSTRATTMSRLLTRIWHSQTKRLKTLLPKVRPMCYNHGVRLVRIAGYLSHGGRTVEVSDF